MNGSKGERPISERAEQLSWVVVNGAESDSVLIYSFSLVHTSFLTDAESDAG